MEKLRTCHRYVLFYFFMAFFVMESLLEFQYQEGMDTTTVTKVMSFYVEHDGRAAISGN